MFNLEDGLSADFPEEVLVLQIFIHNRKESADSVKTSIKATTTAAAAARAAVLLCQRLSKLFMLDHSPTRKKSSLAHTHKRFGTTNNKTLHH